MKMQDSNNEPMTRGEASNCGIYKNLCLGGKESRKAKTKKINHIFNYGYHTSTTTIHNRISSEQLE